MAQSFELEGTVKVIEDIQTFASGFSKREFVIEVEDGKFPQSIKFECVKEKTALIDEFQIGDPVKVYFDIRGNEYKGKYYVNLNAWKLERPGAAGGGGRSSGGGRGEPRRNSAPAQGTPYDDGPTLSEPPGGYGQESDDDIPF
ncbi:MAG: DUF3127 domain-containing protein [Verrucomicrobia bacterium]|jgi:single-strand DNA-binding protein|nr:DUF3127 domain-containing protein [Verrucomicrobiota bacterium]